MPGELSRMLPRCAGNVGIGGRSKYERGFPGKNLSCREKKLNFWFFSNKIKYFGNFVDEIFKFFCKKNRKNLTICK